jgi:DNA-damage-inducible protein J
MSKTESTTVRSRISHALKEDVEKIFKRLGLSSSEAIRIFYHHVELYNGLPFKVEIPNKEDRKIIEEANAGKDFTTNRGIE